MYKPALPRPLLQYCKGRNINDDEFKGIRDQLGEANFQLGNEEYKNDLPSPAVSALPAASASESVAIVPQPPPKDEAPLTQKDWDKLDSMVGRNHLRLDYCNFFIYNLLIRHPTHFATIMLIATRHEHGFAKFLDVDVIDSHHKSIIVFSADFRIYSL